jgi:hypothetical protein
MQNSPRDIYTSRRREREERDGGETRKQAKQAKEPCESFKLQTLISGYARHHGNNTPGIVVNNMPAVKFKNFRRFFTLSIA